MRKIIATGLLVVFTCLCSVPQATAAEPTITAQKATEIAKSIVVIPDNVKAFRSNYAEYSGRGMWNLLWETEEGNISVNVDVLSGEITQLYQYSESPDKTSLLPTVDRNTAIKVANEFLGKAAPSKFKALKIVEQKENDIISSYNQTHTINYQRMVNNLPYLQNSAYINISGQTGMITTFDLNWTYDLKFPSAAGVISQEKAEDTLKNKALELMYYKPNNNKSNNQVYLVYGTRQPANILVDAHTGEYIESSHYRVMYDEMAKAMGGASPQSELSPIEIEEIDLLQGLLPKEDALNMVKKYIEIPADYELTHSNLYQDYQEKDKRRWSFEWQSTAEAKTGYLSAGVDAKSGELLSFYKSDYSPERQNQKANYSYEQALKIAQDFMVKLQPQKANQVKLNKDIEQEYLQEIRLSYPVQPDTKEITFEYTRLVNNIPFYNDSFNIGVDLVNGQIISYRYNWSNLNFPAPHNLISLDKAFANLINENSVSLDYITPYEYSERRTGDKEVGLYYHFSTTEPRLVDAFKGTVLNNNGEEFKKKTSPKLIDIAGHPAENDINTLLGLGIIAGNEGRYFPDNNITNAEFIKMLVMSVGGYPGEGRKIEALGNEWYSPYYQTAIHRKIIAKDNLPAPHEPLTRINAAHMMIKAMNLENIAELEGIYQVPAADSKSITGKNTGYAALTVKLGLFKLKSGNLNINDIMQKGESASTLVQLMRVYQR